MRVARAGTRADVSPWRARWIQERRALEASGRLYLFAPLCVALGILLYFSLPHEPSATLLFVGAAAIGWFGRHALAGRASALFVAGLAIPALHVALLGDLPQTLPDDARRITGVVERIEGRVERGARLTLRVEDGLRETGRLQLSAREMPDVRPGDRVTVVATARYAPGPVLPGHYDHARRLYFQGIDAVGIVIAGPYQASGPAMTPADRFRRAVSDARGAIGDRIADVLDGQTAALATALLTGERDGLSEPTMEAMRASGLAHVLAISGMHMGLFCTSLFLALRAALAAIGAAGVRLPVKKLAATGALLGGTFYLVISGAQIATQRAYVMVAIVCVAVLFDRPALTLRNVATAALVVLAVAPESLTGASFQMSFAATIALIAVYERWNARARPSETVLAIPGQQVGTLFLTSLTAGLATAPYAGFHFSRLATYGLAANLAAMPFVTFIVMPAGLASLLAMPFGLETLPLIVMGWGLEGLLNVAYAVSSWPGAIRAVPSPAPAALVLLSVALYGLAIARGPFLRAAAVVGIGLAGAVHLGQPATALLVAENGKTFAVREKDGTQRLVGERFSRFTSDRWTEAVAYRARDTDDAGASDIEPAPTAPRSSCDATQCYFKAEPDEPTVRARHPLIMTAWTEASVQEACLVADILATPLPAPESCPAPALVIDAGHLRLGGLVVSETEGAYRLRFMTPPDRPWRRPMAD